MVDLKYSNALAKMSFDHVGIATASINDSLAFYSALGFESIYREKVETEGVEVAMIQLTNGSKIELLEPMSDESPIAKFLEKKGPGIHHICLRTDQLEPQVKILKEEGFRLINEVPRPGAHNMKVVFIHPKSAGGVLLELSAPREE